jgi:CRISPR-associated Csx2 family protein
MRKVFLSFLGTNDYLPCNYQIAGHDPVANVRFVQEACIARWCVDWGSDDRIFLCVTDESHDRNWVDNGHKDKGGNIPERQGLASRLEGLHLAAPVKPVMVPAGRSEEEIWEIFERVFFLLEEGDQLYLDITHAFRSLPMLAMVILSYAKVMRTVSVRAISYGALEALGSVGDVKNLPMEQRNVPVFDLLPFDRLQDWVTAVDRFTASGDATLIERLADLDMRPVIKATQGQNTVCHGAGYLPRQKYLRHGGFGATVSQAPRGCEHPQAPAAAAAQDRARPGLLPGRRDRRWPGGRPLVPGPPVVPTGLHHPA